MNETDNIELRSEKVRNIIGQIPPRIIRIGITIIFLIIIGLIVGTYFFEYEYIIKTTATIDQQYDTTIIDVKIPANEIDKIKIGHRIVLSFNNILNLYDEKIETEIQTVPNKVEISEKGGYYMVKVHLSDGFHSKLGVEFNVKEKTSVNALIITDKISFFDRMMEPFFGLAKK